MEVACWAISSLKEAPAWKQIASSRPSRGESIPSRNKKQNLSWLAPSVTIPEGVKNGSDLKGLIPPTSRTVVNQGYRFWWIYLRANLLFSQNKAFVLEDMFTTGYWVLYMNYCVKFPWLCSANWLLTPMISVCFSQYFFLLNTHFLELCEVENICIYVCLFLSNL